MCHESAKTERESIHPVIIVNEIETPSSTHSTRKRAPLDALAFLYIFGHLLLNLALGSHATGNDAPAIAPERVPENTEGVPAASVLASTAPLAGDRVLDMDARLSQETRPQEIKKNGPEKWPRKSMNARRSAPKNRSSRHGSSENTPRPPRQPTAQFNEFEAMVAIDKAAQEARICLGANDPRPVMRVAVTFATSGRVKRSEVETGPYQNTSQGDCIARVLRSASVQPFDGSAVTVHRAVVIR